MTKKRVYTKMDEQSSEQVLSLFQNELYSYSYTLLENGALSRKFIVDAFAHYFCNYTSQTPLHMTKVELFHFLWISIRRFKDRAQQSTKNLSIYSYSLLCQYGFSIDEIKQIMRLRPSRVATLQENANSYPALINQGEIHGVKPNCAIIKMDEVRSRIKSMKRKRLKFVLLICCVSLVTLTLSCGNLYRQEHLPAQQSQISLSHPLHLNPPGHIIHTKQWTGSATWDQWQDTRTRQTKSTYHDQELDEVTYWIDHTQFHYVYQKGILQKTTQMTTKTTPSSILNKADTTQFQKQRMAIFHGIDVDEYQIDNLSIYVDQKNHLLLMSKLLSKNPNDSTYTNYFGYEYLQSVGFGFFDPPQLKK